MLDQVTPFHLQSSLEQFRLNLLCAYHILDMNGHGSDGVGHVTARMSGEERFWIHFVGVGFDEVELGDLQLAGFDLRVLEGNRPINLAIAFHVAIYRARPDVNCVVHTHPAHALALGTLGQPLEIITQDGAKLLDEVAFHGGYEGPVLEEGGEAQEIARTLGARSAIVLKHHGIIAVGRSVRDAVLVALDLGMAASVQLLAMAAGRPDTAPLEGARQIKEFLWRDPLLRGRWEILVRRARRAREACIPATAAQTFPPLVHL